MQKKNKIKKETRKLTGVREDVETLEPSCFAGGNIKCCSHCGKVWQFLKKVSPELPQDPDILL